MRYAGKFGMVCLQKTNHQKELINWSKMQCPYTLDVWQKFFQIFFLFFSLLFTAETFLGSLSYYEACGPFCVAKEIFPSSLSSAMRSAMCDGWALFPESLSHFISTNLSRGGLQQRMLHSPPVTLDKFPLPSALLNLTHGAASHTHIILFPWGSAIVFKNCELIVQ